MNIRQQKYKSNRLVGMNMYNAARAAGYSHSYAKQAYRLEKSDKVGIADVFEQAGLTDKKIGNKILELVEATKTISCNVYVDKDGNVKNNEAGGKSLDFIEVEDRGTQLKAIELLCKLKKMLVDKPIIDQSQHTHITYQWGLKSEREDNRDSLLPAELPTGNSQR